MITRPEYIDVIISARWQGLIERIAADAKVPVIKHLDGNYRVYVVEHADLDKSVRIADNAKTVTTGVVARWSHCWCTGAHS